MLSGLLLLLAAGCTTDVVDFTLKGATVQDMAAPACKIVEVGDFQRCKYCAQPGSDSAIKSTCYKLGCLPVDAWAECKSCWWSNTPETLCVICGNKSGIYKNTCKIKTLDM